MSSEETVTPATHREQWSLEKDACLGGLAAGVVVGTAEWVACNPSSFSSNPATANTARSNTTADENIAMVAGTPLVFAAGAVVIARKVRSWRWRSRLTKQLEAIESGTDLKTFVQNLPAPDNAPNSE